MKLCRKCGEFYDDQLLDCPVCGNELVEVHEMNKENNNIVSNKFKSAVNELKDAGLTLAKQLAGKRTAMHQLEEIYCKQKANELAMEKVKSQSRRVRLFASLQRQMENFRKRKEQDEKRLAFTNDRKEMKHLKNDRDRCKSLLQTLEKNMKRLEDEHRKDEKNKDKEPFKNMEKARQSFARMTDEQKVEYAIKLDRQGNSFGKEFLQNVVEYGNEMKMNVRSQEMAADALGMDKNYAVRDNAERIAAMNKIARDGEASIYKSTLEIAEDNAQLKKTEPNDVRKSFSVTNDARSAMRTDAHLDEQYGKAFDRNVIDSYKTNKSKTNSHDRSDDSSGLSRAL